VKCRVHGGPGDAGVIRAQILADNYRDGNAEPDGSIDALAIVEVYDGSTVPVLIDGDVVIWESLAIIEYLAERFAGLEVWPRHAGARALARSRTFRTSSNPYFSAPARSA